ncbi:MAG: PTS sugar transporter subunit IIA [Alphaproteobacteria bacterium]|nr:PTS sugar transporter subunit IIA [Alphaproteobacteria bacterium]
MDIASILSPEGVIVRCSALNKRQVLQEIAKRAHDTIGINERDVLTALIERERLGSTGVGKGVAYPHARFKQLTELTAIFVRLHTPVEFDSADGKPVDLLFALLAPEQGDASNLRAMARVSRLLRNSHNCEKIRHAVTADIIYSLLTAEDAELDS